MEATLFQVIGAALLERPDFMRYCHAQIGKGESDLGPDDETIHDIRQLVAAALGPRVAQDSIDTSPVDEPNFIASPIRARLLHAWSLAADDLLIALCIGYGTALPRGSRRTSQN